MPKLINLCFWKILVLWKVGSIFNVRNLVRRVTIRIHKNQFKFILCTLLYLKPKTDARHLRCCIVWVNNIFENLFLRLKLHEGEISKIVNTCLIEVRYVGVAIQKQHWRIVSAHFNIVCHVWLKHAFYERLQVLVVLKLQF